MLKSTLFTIKDGLLFIAKDARANDIGIRAITVVIYGKKSRPSKSPSKSHVPQTVGQRVPQILDYGQETIFWTRSAVARATDGLLA